MNVKMKENYFYESEMLCKDLIKQVPLKFSSKMWWDIYKKCKVMKSVIDFTHQLFHIYACVYIYI